MLNSFGASIKKTLLFIQNISPFPDNIWSLSWKATCAMKRPESFLFFSIFYFSFWGLANKIFHLQKKTKPGRNFGNWNENTFLHSRSSFENETTRFRTKMAKVYNRFQTESVQKPYPFGLHTLYDLRLLGYWLRGHVGERNNCLVKSK